MRCEVYGCDNTNCGSRPAVGVHYHSFPRDKRIQKLWVVLCRPKDNFNVKTARVCSVHFNPEDYRPNISDFFASYGLKHCRKKLLPGAVPSNHLPKGQNDAQSASKLARRSERAHKRLAVSYPTEDATISSVANTCGLASSTRAFACKSEPSESADTSSALKTPSYAYIPGSASIAYITSPDSEAAKKLARRLIVHQLAAAVNIIPGVTSIYRWDGEMQEDTEVMLIVKTETSRVDALSEFVRRNHYSYVISTKIENGNDPYMQFLHNALHGSVRK